MEKDELIHSNRYGHRKLSFSLLRTRPVALADMELIGPPFLQPPHPTISLEGQLWNPDIEVDRRVRAFSHRLLRDFNYQWRHILRNEYNSTTLRVLAKAVIRLSTFDFDVREEGGKGSEPSPTFSHVGITTLPAWEPFSSAIEVVLIGNVHVVICVSLEEGLLKAQDHVAHQKPKSHIRCSSCLEPNYMILSIKHIMLCRITNEDILEYTNPELLFNGNSDPEFLSDRALDYLLWGTRTGIKAISIPLQSLPTEVQDNILQHVSFGPVAGAKIGCIFSLGSPFLWKYDSLDIKLIDTIRDGEVRDPVESTVYFDGVEVGIVYKRKRQEH